MPEMGMVATWPATRTAAAIAGALGRQFRRRISTSAKGTASTSARSVSVSTSIHIVYSTEFWPDTGDKSATIAAGTATARLMSQPRRSAGLSGYQRDQHRRVRELRERGEHDRGGPLVVAPAPDRGDKHRRGPQERELAEQQSFNQRWVDQRRDRPPAVAQLRERPQRGGHQTGEAEAEHERDAPLTHERPQQHRHHPGDERVRERQRAAVRQHRHVEREAMSVPEL